ncbi:hypothetical protein [Shewanella fidelis]|uniref:hypothetical protein n=1 Tax=Shewanella fidelis TaxID=173509 RepID=UPI0004B6C539|nr:hypothetical protein [Shewanella fidelis]
MNALLRLLQFCRWLTLAAIFLIALLASKPASKVSSIDSPDLEGTLNPYSALALTVNAPKIATITHQLEREKPRDSQVEQLSQALRTEVTLNEPDNAILEQQLSHKNAEVTKEKAIQSIVSVAATGVALESTIEPPKANKSRMSSQPIAGLSKTASEDELKTADGSVYKTGQNQSLPVQPLQASQSNIGACDHQLAIPYTREVADEALFLVTQLFYADMLLSNEMFAYHVDGRFYLPLEFIVEQLLLPLQVDIDTFSAHGWFVDEAKTIQIDQQLMLFWNQGVDCSTTASVIFHDSWDLYLDTKILQQLFGVEVTFDPARQKFDIAASDNIPLSQLIERQKKYQLFNAQKNSADKRPIKEINKQYALVGDLALNIDVGVRTQSIKDDVKTETDSYVQARTDIFSHNSYVAYSHTANGTTFNGYLERILTDQWFNFYRLGDVDSHNLSLVADSTRGTGAVVSAGDGFNADLRTIVVDGELEPGWDVELYRNNTLIGVQRVQSDGLYRFSDVPYYIGLNQYQLRFFGPNGESRIESFSKLLDNSVLEKGSVGVNVGAITREQDDLKQYYADINWAVREDMTLGMALVQQQDEQKQWQFLPRLAVNFVGDAQLVELNYVQSQQGYATSAAIQGSQSYIDWQAEWQKYSNYSTWDNVDGRINEQAFVSLSGGFNELGINWGLNGRWQALNIGSDNAQMNFLLSGRVNTLTVSNELRWSSLNKREQWRDRIALSGRLNNWQLRSYVDLELVPDVMLNQWVSNINTAINDDANYQLELRYQPNSDTEFSMRNSIAYFFDFGSLRLDIDNASNGDWFAQMKWNSAILWDTKPDRWLVDRMSYINTGAVKIIAFQDDNANGLFEEDELAISGLRFSGHSQSNKQTDENGELLITQLQTNRQQKLVLNENSLKDPFLIPAAHIISVNPHPGHIQPILFPVMFTSELEGEVVYFDSGIAATGKLLELRSVTSALTYQTRVEYDGVFIFEQIRPGEYQLFLDAELIRSIKLMPGEFLQLPQLIVSN